MKYSRITVDPNQMDGVPCIRGLRIPVATLIRLLAEGETTDSLLDLYPDLQREDIREALAYAAASLGDREIPLAS